MVFPATDPCPHRVLNVGGGGALSTWGAFPMCVCCDAPAPPGLCVQLEPIAVFVVIPSPLGSSLQVQAQTKTLCPLGRSGTQLPREARVLPNT